MIRRLVVALLVSFVAACATPAPSGALRVELLETGFLVDNTILATTSELRAFIADARARSVTLAVPKGTTNERIDRAASAIRDSGAAVEIVMGTTP